MANMGIGIGINKYVLTYYTFVASNLYIAILFYNLFNLKNPVRLGKSHVHFGSGLRCVTSVPMHTLRNSHWLRQ